MASSHSRLTRFLLLGLVILVLTSISMVSVGRRLALAICRPFLETYRICETVAIDLYSRVSPEPHYRRLRLESELRQAQAVLWSTRDIQEQNIELRAMLKVGAPTGWRAVHATILTRDPMHWNWEFTIDKGIGDGVKVGLPVLAGACLAGRVREVFQHTAVVTTLYSPQCSFSVFVVHQEEKHFGLYSGSGPQQGNHGLTGVVDALSKDVVLQPGDPVFTSGLGTQLPYGIPVGTIAPQSPCPRLIHQAHAAVTITPQADLKSRHFITILIPVK